MIRKHVHALLDTLSIVKASDIEKFSDSMRNALASLFVNILGLFLNFILTLVLAKLLVPEEFGVYVYIYTWLGILLIISVLGFDSLMVRSIPKYVVQNKTDQLRGLLRYGNRVTFAASLGLGLVVMIVVLAVEFQQKSQLYAVLTALLCLPLMSIGLVKQSILRGLHRITQSRVPDIVVRPTIVITLVATFYLTGRSLNSFDVMLFQLAGVVVALGISSYFVLKYMKNYREGSFQYEKTEWHSVAFPLLLISGMFSLLNYIDTVMIGIMSTSRDVAVYALATKFAVLVLFVLQAFNVVIAPKISEYYSAGDHEKLQDYVSSMSRIMFFATLPIVLLLVLFGDVILGYFGVDYRQGYSVMVLLAAGQIVNVSFGPVGFLLSMTNYQNLSFKILLVSLVVNVILNVPAIYYFNITGAAGATAFSIILRNFLMWLYAKRHLGINSFVI